MLPPWISDHGLSRDALAHRLRTALGSSQPVDPSLLGLQALADRSSWSAARFPAAPVVEWCDQGWDCDVFRTCDEDGVVWLCKVPKRAEVAASVAKEAALLVEIAQADLRIAPQVGLWIPAASSRSGTLPYGCLGVSVAPGVALLGRLRGVDAVRLGASYGAVLRDLHRLAPRALGDRPAEVPLRLGYFLEQAPRAIAALRRHVAPAVADEAAAMVDRVRARDLGMVPTAFIHGDLFPEHVFFDPKSFAVTCLIDWADARWGDPAVDFALPGWLLGEAFLDAAIAAYAPASPQTVRERAICCGAMVGILDIAEAEAGAPNVPLEERIEVVRTRTREGWLGRV